MKTIDLHGVKHKDVEKVVSEAVCDNEVPLRIITGNSTVMKNLVIKTLKHFDLTAVNSIGNSGILLVYETRRNK